MIGTADLRVPGPTLARSGTADWNLLAFGFIAFRRFQPTLRPRNMYRAAILATLLIALVGHAAAQPNRAGAPKGKAELWSPPMIYYLAKGEEGICGPGCSEWIAAEGQIDA